MEVENNAASTPAMEVPTDPQHYATWRLTGKLPEAPKATSKTEESTTSGTSKETHSATTAEEADGQTAADSEAATQELKKGKGAEDRIKQLVAEKKELERKLAEGSKTEAKTETKKAESSTAKPTEALEAPKKPKQEDFKDWNEYETAKDKYFEDLADFKAKKALQDHVQQQARRARDAELSQQLTDARTRYKDADAVIRPVAVAVLDNTSQVHPIVKAMLDDSPVMIDVLYMLGSDEKELADFVQLASTKPLEAVRKLAALEASVKSSSGKGSETKATTVRDAEGKFTKIAEKTEKPPEEKVTKAPPPAHEVGGRGSQPADESERAVKANDFRAFRDAENRRDLARRRG